MALCAEGRTGTQRQALELIQSRTYRARARGSLESQISVLTAAARRLPGANQRVGDGARVRTTNPPAGLNTITSGTGRQERAADAPAEIFAGSGGLRRYAVTAAAG